MSSPTRGQRCEDRVEGGGARTGSDPMSLEGEGIWRQFTIADGLPDMKIECLFADSRGNLWIGTHDRGVVRYDGTRFEGFSRRDGLPGDGVYSVLEDEDGSLWFGTSGGLGRYDGEVMERVECGEPASFLWGNCQSEDGTLWFGLERSPESPAGVVRVRDGGPCRLLADSDWGLVGQSVHQIVTHDGQIVCAGHGLYVVDGDGLRCVDAPSANMRQVQAMISRADGSLWVLSDTSLLLCRINSAVQYESLLEDQLMRAIAGDTMGRLWIVTDDGRLLCHNDCECRVVSKVDARFWRALLVDQRGRCWVGSYGMGLFSYDETRLQVFTRRHGLPARETNCVTAGRDGMVWIGTRDGLARLGNGRFESVVGGEEPGDTAVTALQADATGKVWAGTRNGYVIGYHANGEIHQVSALPDGYTVNQLEEGLDGRIWFSARYGGALGYLQHNGHTEIGLSELPLCPTSVGGMAIDGSGCLWLGSAGTDGSEGLRTYDGTAFGAVDVELACPVLSLLWDRRDRLWIGTNRGLVCRDGARVTWFTQADGLPCDIVISIVEDDDGVIWFGTEGGGLGCFDGKVFQVTAIPGNVSLNVVKDLHIGSGGSIWMSTHGGLVRFQRGGQAPSVRVIEVTGDGILGDPQRAEIPTSCPSIAFCVEGTSPIEDPLDLVYQYRLENHDDTWHQTRDREIAYPCPKQGQYRFLVRAVDRDLSYSELAEVDVMVTADPKSAAYNEALKSSTLKGDFIGSSEALAAVKKGINQVASTDATVLVLGETGTGKGLVAKAVHELSPRSEGPFVHVNCGSIQDTLIDSELFGHERGSFTGAIARRLGKLELGQGGTIFLDEIGDLPLPFQARLLHVLQESVITRVGGTEAVPLDVRVVAATNRDVVQGVARETFREDLYYRLNGFTIEMPPLRDRRDDVPALATHFAARSAAHLNRSPPAISREAMQGLKAYQWPGNVRELEHMMERAVILADGGEITPDHITTGPRPVHVADANTEILPLQEHERRYLTRVLSHTNGVIQGDDGAAALLGLNPSTLRSRLIKLGIRVSKPARRS